MADDPRAVFSRLPPYVVHHPVKLKELRSQWDQGCSRILHDAHLTSDQKIKVTMDWLAKAGVRDFVLGKLILGFARPLPVPPTDEQRKERRQKNFVRLAYTEELPRLRAVNKVVTQRLEEAPADALGSLKDIDSVDDRERENPGTMFAEFAKHIDDQVLIEYQGVNKDDGSSFADAAQ